jgi:NADH:ubiquinone oxidoreductase subunit B-like Fe-S oxidoreductase
LWFGLKEKKKYSKKWSLLFLTFLLFCCAMTVCGMGSTIGNIQMDLVRDFGLELLKLILETALIYLV